MTIIQHRRGTTAQWADPQNGPLASGEWGLDIDTGQARMGDGVTAFDALPVIGGGGALPPRQTWDIEIRMADPGFDPVIPGVAGLAKVTATWKNFGDWGVGQARFTLGSDATVPVGSVMYVRLPWNVPQDDLYDCGYALSAGGPLAPGTIAYGNMTGGDLSGTFGLAPGSVDANLAIIDSPSSYIDPITADRNGDLNQIVAGGAQSPPGLWNSTFPLAAPGDGAFWRFAISSPIATP